MKLRLAILALSAVLCAPAHAQWPSNGTIGVYADAAGTLQCIQIAPFVPTTFYVIARAYGAASAGITGAQFRIEFSDLSGYLLLPFTPVPEASVVIGTVFDSTACDRNPAGIDIAFPDCRATNGEQLLGTFVLFGLGGTHPVYMSTKRRLPAVDPGMKCPLFYLCDPPEYSKVCLTLREGDPGLGGYEPVASISAVNPPYCGYGQPSWSCPPLAVVARTWSLVKSAYR